MTGNCSALTALADEPGYVTMNPVDAKKLGVRDEQLVWVASRRGKVISRAKVTERTIHHVDPISKTPEYKYAAVRVEAIADQVWAESRVQQDYTRLKQRLTAA